MNTIITKLNIFLYKKFLTLMKEIQYVRSERYNNAEKVLMNWKNHKDFLSKI